MAQAIACECPEAQAWLQVPRAPAGSTSQSTGQRKLWSHPPPPKCISSALKGWLAASCTPPPECTIPNPSWPPNGMQPLPLALRLKGTRGTPPPPSVSDCGPCQRLLSAPNGPPTDLHPPKLVSQPLFQPPAIACPMGSVSRPQAVAFPPSPNTPRPPTPPKKKLCGTFRALFLWAHSPPGDSLQNGAGGAAAVRITAGPMARVLACPVPPCARRHKGPQSAADSGHARPLPSGGPLSLGKGGGGVPRDTIPRRHRLLDGQDCPVLMPRGMGGAAWKAHRPEHDLYGSGDDQDSNDKYATDKSYAMTATRTTTNMATMRSTIRTIPTITSRTVTPVFATSTTQP